MNPVLPLQKKSQGLKFVVIFYHNILWIYLKIKHNNLLYAVPYQHFTNVIEGYFSVLKSKLRKKNDVGLEKLKQNIRKLIKEIPKATYKKLFEGSYNRIQKYKPKKSRAKTLKRYK